MVQAPPARRRLVGSALRRYRQHLGWPLEEAARILECDRSKISRIETGQRGIRPKELRELLTSYGIPDPGKHVLAAIASPRFTSGWWLDHTGILTDTEVDMLAMENLASHIMTYDPQHIPGLLRTPDYICSLTAGSCLTADAAPSQITDLAAARHKAIIGGQRTGISAVVGEAALHQMTGNTDTMRAQLRQLADLSATCPWITIQILPFTASLHPDSGPMTIARFPDAPSLGAVHLPGLSGGVILVDQDDVTRHLAAFSQLQLAALPIADTAELLRDTATGL
jgi:transcriptional regulator with XRE-family HTH domain